MRGRPEDRPGASADENVAASPALTVVRLARLGGAGELSLQLPTAACLLGAACRHTGRSRSVRWRTGAGLCLTPRRRFFLLASASPRRSGPTGGGEAPRRIHDGRRPLIARHDKLAPDCHHFLSPPIAPMWPAITHADVRRGAGQSPRLSVPVPSLERGGPAEARTGRRTKVHGATRFLHASAPGSWRPLRPPDPSLEPEDGALHLRRARQHPHHRPVADHAAAAPGPGEGARSRRVRRPGAVRRHQAPGLRAGGHGRQALRPVLCQPPLAGRHADQLAHHLRLDRAPARTGRRAGRRATPAAPRRSCCSSPASATSWSCPWAASRTWAASPT